MTSTAPVEEGEPMEKLTDEEVEQIPLLASDNSDNVPLVPPPSFDWTQLRLSSLWTLEMPSFAKLLFGAGGIYAAFMYYGVLLEDIFLYEAENGDKFKEGNLFSFLILFIIA